MSEPILTRAVCDNDREAVLHVEREAIPGTQYLGDAWELFAHDAIELTCALRGDALCGVGKLTGLYGPYGWLEALRVLPAQQGQGFGKAIYRRFFELAEQNGLTAFGMYTGAANRVSRGLAERFGLRLCASFAELSLPVPPAAAESALRPVPPAEGEAAAAPFYGEMGGFLAVNRTFFPVRPGLGAELARRGWLYAGGDSLAVCGWRFQPERTIHLAYCGGDPAPALALAASLARQTGAPRIVTLRPEACVPALSALGFADGGTRLITLWRGL